MLCPAVQRCHECGSSLRSRWPGSSAKLCADGRERAAAGQEFQRRWPRRTWGVPGGSVARSRATSILVAPCPATLLPQAPRCCWTSPAVVRRGVLGSPCFCALLANTVERNALCPQWIQAQQAGACHRAGRTSCEGSVPLAAGGALRGSFTPSLSPCRAPSGCGGHTAAGGCGYTVRIPKHLKIQLVSLRSRWRSRDDVGLN